VICLAKGYGPPRAVTASSRVDGKGEQKCLLSHDLWLQPGARSKSGPESPIGCPARNPGTVFAGLVSSTPVCPTNRLTEAVFIRPVGGPEPSHSPASHQRPVLASKLHSGLQNVAVRTFHGPTANEKFRLPELPVSHSLGVGFRTMNMDRVATPEEQEAAIEQVVQMLGPRLDQLDAQTLSVVVRGLRAKLDGFEGESLPVPAAFKETVAVMAGLLATMGHLLPSSLEKDIAMQGSALCVNWVSVSKWPRSD
jgi:hypothetical protein